MSMSGYYNIGAGSDAESIHTIHRALDLGVTHLDTAEIYGPFTNEELVGRAIKGRRDQVVLATKFSFATRPGDPNSGGNGRKHVYSALEGSLRRLKTDYVDLYWLHAWDGLTPVEEVVGTMDALVRSGKVRYFGLSDTPGWYLARAETMAELRGTARVVALLLDEDRRAVAAALRERAAIARAADMAADALAAGGRVVFLGAGTSGRLGILEAAECPPTFGVEPDIIRGVMAGGEDAVFRAVEGAEDRADEGRDQAQRLRSGVSLFYFGGSPALRRDQSGATS